MLFTFVPNKQFGQLNNMSPHSLIMLNTINTESSFIDDVWFTIKTVNLLKLKMM